MGSLAQALLRQFGLHSQLAGAINAGRDPHTMVAAIARGCSETDVTREMRHRAKPINFGKPGGMGMRALRDYALAGYGVELSEAEAIALSDAWFVLFPEMREFLENDGDICEGCAIAFDLTRASFRRETGSDL